ncbi:hypothetical protein IQ268_00715 [Oculatella sp. LEGE 06141]|uniref:hypothetical protein n=1 Tax=Oculatella sp. LEGE 06141 TaxID=1828648 RepID=UPI001882B7CA|nr:hypothetical protein [Oculatella sp. LEGE 06141]MBE9177096.1 hypothetical protein [Oculatella sp. LEGE 06141]
MRDIGYWSALGLTVLTVLGGYSPVLADPGLPSGANSTNHFRMAANRNTAARPTSIREALLGQWTTNGGTTHYFFNQGQVTVVNTLPGREQPAQQYAQVMDYEITLVNEAEGLVFLKLETPLGWAERRMIRFSPNRLTMTESMNVMGHIFGSEWTYVDDLQQPLVAENSYNNGSQ